MYLILLLCTWFGIGHIANAYWTFCRYMIIQWLVHASLRVSSIPALYTCFVLKNQDIFFMVCILLNKNIMSENIIDRSTWFRCLSHQVSQKNCQSYFQLMILLGFWVSVKISLLIHWGLKTVQLRTDITQNQISTPKDPFQMAMKMVYKWGWSDHHVS